VFTCDPAVVKHILKDNFNNYVKSETGFSILNDLIGNGIFNVDHGPHASDQGESWLIQRKVTSNIFTKSAFKSDVISKHYLMLGQAIRGSF